MASELNQYAISKILGSTMRPVKQVRFGNFPLLESTAEVVRQSLPSSADPSANKMSYEDDAVVVRAFEDVRSGKAPDAILTDKALAHRFYHRCRELNLPQPEALLGRRLINIRKNSPRYKQHGITLSPTTVSEPHPSIVPQFAHVIEFALVRLRYRFGASIDDVLLDPELGGLFEQLASAIAPGLASQDLRLGALYIRKTRYLDKKDVKAIKSLDLAAIEAKLIAPISLSVVRPEEVPASPGLIELREKNRYLYVARNQNLRDVVGQLRTGQAFEIMASAFWMPNLETITLQFAPGELVAGVRVNVWERRLIHDLEPVFNWPIQKKEEAA